MIKFSRAGAKDNRARLRWVKYFKYILEGEEYYTKMKAYTTHADGWIEEELIVKETYDRAVKRGKQECRSIVVEDNILKTSRQALPLIYSEKYQISYTAANKSVYKAREALLMVTKHCDISGSTGFRMFNKLFETHLTMQDEERIAM
ncbi:hypothetical protein RBU61_14270 [Tissierella sp. MB52-C2]|uniref:hypothetical protein n=1 Tax=Tissierella sp. MB52-C2 TaxID=3070999 RepID=UPI00280B95F7|nr:hypothetical protein [Tissierella sp. MB52-C2]WMM24081.1 hypothetical protein RBU61_14270 [Tissierella sp. MB52-C2]